MQVLTYKSICIYIHNALYFLQVSPENDDLDIGEPCSDENEDSNENEDRDNVEQCKEKNEQEKGKVTIHTPENAGLVREMHSNNNGNADSMLNMPIYEKNIPRPTTTPLYGGDIQQPTTTPLYGGYIQKSTTTPLYGEDIQQPTTTPLYGGDIQ